MKWLGRASAFMLSMLILFSLSGCDLPDSFNGLFGEADKEVLNPDTTVHFIDCGQGDSTLFLSDGKATLIDAGPGVNADFVVNYIKDLGVSEIDSLIFTHPHEDHIGGGYDILSEFKVNKVYMKKPSAGTSPTTAVYRNLLQKISQLGMKISAVTPESTFECGKLTFTFLGPLKDYDNLNDQSVCVSAKTGKIRFLITGDAEGQPESDLYKAYGKNALSCNVFKAAHHGSRTSNSEKLLKAAAPQYAVISCGADNSYNHPHSETVKRFDKLKITYFRTDTAGSVVFKTDGETVVGKAEKTA